MKEINTLWTDLYYVLRHENQEAMSHQAVRILQMIEKEAEVGVKNVAEALKISPNTASEHVKRLVADGLVAKARSIQDERRVTLELTAKGGDTLYRHSSLDEEKLQRVFNELTESERAETLHTLNRLRDKANALYRH
ncbi:winged helix-turn-helix transcriptional regulator [Paenalkalicoccus suaedae]|uniref:Winged helix-turn-helix transcriptional regulator n=1 Tax=Paenalkalicoccus suaedae TaxID=2592382 RepID=A0A859FCN4_9BACI|nr:MarR family winged helix-turn-helix transcriptional regulator [Paenalkalicoccus suaedae]QKS69976.1 winged helix-turn-helix transcriptional regulator [Paenalkalicoccus suaedae]